LDPLPSFFLLFDLLSSTGTLFLVSESEELTAVQRASFKNLVEVAEHSLLLVYALSSTSAEWPSQNLL
jgi:hypothetical protein